MSESLLRAFFVSVAVSWGFLVVMDGRILVSEEIVEEGRPLPPRFRDDWGPGQVSSKSIACTYFDGRALRRKVFAFSPSGFMGRDSCPAIMREGAP